MDQKIKEFLVSEVNHTRARKPYTFKVTGRNGFGNARQYDIFYDGEWQVTMNNLDYESAQYIVNLLNGAYMMGRADTLIALGGVCDV